MHCRDFHRRQMQQKEFLQILVVVVMDAAISLSGTGTLASVIVLKDFVKEHNLQGTIRYYGCPAEENAGGKAFLCT